MQQDLARTNMENVQRLWKTSTQGTTETTTEATEGMPMV
jgi:hypothetical protein